MKAAKLTMFGQFKKELIANGMQAIVREKTIQAIPVKIMESNGQYLYKYQPKEEWIESKKRFNSESQALNAAEKTIEYYWYVGH